MDEEALRAMLTRIAADPEPPARIDIDAARRRGRRRLLSRLATQVAAGPLAIALAAGVIVTVPHALFARTQRIDSSVPAGSSAPAAPRPDSAPASFNPLVPYAAFGWLPVGFSEGAVSPLWSNPFVSDRASLTLAAQNALGRTLFLTVNSRGTCPLEASSAKSLPGCVIEQDGPGVSRVPDINGRPAWYAGWGSSISWEYAPGAWATLDAGVSPVLPTKAASKAEAGSWVKASVAAEKGWVLSPTSPQTRETLRSVASSVKFGQATPLAFPFRLSGLAGSGKALPPGWQLTSASFRPLGGKLVGRGISAGPTADASALSAGTIPPDGYGCNFVTGQSSYVTMYGISWIDRVTSQPNKDDETLCSTGAAPAGLVDGLQVFINLEADNPGSNSPLPGVRSLGGAFGVFSRMKFLGAAPSSWTTDPLG